MTHTAGFEAVIFKGASEMLAPLSQAPQKMPTLTYLLCISYNNRSYIFSDSKVSICAYDRGWKN